MFLDTGTKYHAAPCLSMEEQFAKPGSQETAVDLTFCSPDNSGIRHTMLPCLPEGNTPGSLIVDALQNNFKSSFYTFYYFCFYQ